APRLVFVAPDSAHLLADSAHGADVVEVGVELQSDAYRAWRSGPGAIPPIERVARPDDVVVQTYTTGTTGFPKGVLLTERNLGEMTSSMPRTFRATAGSRYLALLPMFHISGGGTPVGTLLAGGTVVMPSGTSSRAVLGD